MTFTSFCEKLSDRLEQFCLIAAGLLLVVNLTAVMLGVFARFYRPPVWTTDLAKVTLVWVVMLAAAPALKRGEHMAISIIVDRLPQLPRRCIITFRAILFFAILVFMIWLGVAYAHKMRLFTIMTLGIKKTLPLAAVPVGMGLMLLEYSLQQAVGLDNFFANAKEKQL